LSGDAGVAQGELERGEPLPMFPHPFGEEDLLGDHVLAQFSSSRNFELSEKSNTAICEDCMKKERKTIFINPPSPGAPAAGTDRFDPGQL
jgi:hypothetical protein